MVRKSSKSELSSRFFGRLNFFKNMSKSLRWTVNHISKIIRELNPQPHIKTFKCFGSSKVRTFVVRRFKRSKFETFGRSEIQTCQPPIFRSCKIWNGPMLDSSNLQHVMLEQSNVGMIKPLIIPMLEHEIVRSFHRSNVRRLKSYSVRAIHL